MGLCVSSEGLKIPWAAFKDDRWGYVASNHGKLFALSTAPPLNTSRFFWPSVRLRTQRRGHIDAVLALIVWLIDKKSLNNRKAFARVPQIIRILMIVTCSSFFLDLRFGASR